MIEGQFMEDALEHRLEQILEAFFRVITRWVRVPGRRSELATGCWRSVIGHTAVE